MASTESADIPALPDTPNTPASPECCNKDENDETNDCPETFSHTLLDLPWQDVLWTKVLAYLSIPDCFSLRLVNQEYKKMIESYFSSSYKLDLTHVGDRISETAFEILVRDNSTFQTIILKNSFLTTAVVTPVIERNPRLKHLSIKNCTALDDCILLTVSTSCRQLTYLNISGCTWLHNVGLVTIAYKCYSLDFLNINNCSNITDEGIRTLVFHCQKITTLKCKNVYQLTNYGVELIVKACPQMTKLDLRGCYRLTDKSINVILEHGQNIAELKVKNCQNISEQCLVGAKSKIKLDVEFNMPSKDYFPRIYF